MTSEASHEIRPVMILRRAEPWEEQFGKDLHYLLDNMDDWTRRKVKGNGLGCMKKIVWH